MPYQRKRLLPSKGPTPINQTRIRDDKKGASLRESGVSDPNSNNSSDNLPNKKLCPDCHCSEGHHQPYHLGDATTQIQDHHHSCVKLTEVEFINFATRIPIVDTFEKVWKTKAAYMPRICGRNIEKSYCRTARTSVRCECHTIDSKHSVACQFLIPVGMPYTIVKSRLFGEVYCTPFYTVIPQLILQVPSVLFSLHRLTLSKVVNNFQFRHELAFNKDLQIELPESMVEVSISSNIWSVLAYEIKDIFLSPVARPPIPVLVQMLAGLKSLMISVLPAAFTSSIMAYLDPTRFIEGEPSLRVQSLSELTNFLESTLDLCVISARKRWIKKMNESFAEGLESPEQLVAGLRTATALFNLTKVDQINARIKDRVTLLRQNTGKIEKTFYKTQVQTGNMNPSVFTSWIIYQPDAWDIINRTAYLYQTTDRTFSMLDIEDKQSWVLNRLLAGFLWSNMRDASRKPVSSIFKIDATRISSLQRRFDKLIMRSLTEEVEKTHTHFRDASVLLSSKGIRKSKVYRLVESRMLSDITRHVYVQLLVNASGRNKYNHNKQIKKLMQQNNTDELPPALVSLISEISTLLILHWTGTRDYYEAL